MESIVIAKLTIWHTYESGTILGGTSKGDVASDLLGNRRHGGLGWKWSSHITTPDDQAGAWYIRMSRDKPAKTWEINHAVQRLEQAATRLTSTLTTRHATWRPARWTAPVAWMSVPRLWKQKPVVAPIKRPPS